MGWGRADHLLTSRLGTAVPSFVPDGQPEGKSREGIPVELDAVPSCSLCHMCSGLYCPLLPPPFGRQHQALHLSTHVPCRVLVRCCVLVRHQCLSSPTTLPDPYASLPPILPGPPGRLGMDFLAGNAAWGGSRPEDNAGTGTTGDGGAWEQMGTGNWEVSHHQAAGAAQWERTGPL